MSNNLYVNISLMGLFFAAQSIDSLYAVNQYADYGRHVLSNEKAIKVTPVKPHKKDKHAAQLKALQNGLGPIDPFLKKQLIFKELAKHSAIKTESTVLSPQALKDLSVLQADEAPKAHKSRLFGVFNRMTTTFGSAGLARLLAEPLTDITRIKQRQAVVRALVENKQVADDFREVLQSIAKGEHLFLGYFVAQNDLDKKVYNQVYFSNRFDRLNTSPVALELLRACHVAWNGLGFMPLNYYFKVMGRATIDAIEGDYASILLQPVKTIWPTIKDEIRLHDPRILVPTAEQMMRNPDIVPAIGPDTYATSRDYLEMQVYHVTLNAQENAQQRNILRQQEYYDQIAGMTRKIGYATLGSMELIAHIIWYMRAKSAAHKIGFEHDILRSIQTRMIGVGRVIRAMDELYQLVKDNNMQQGVPQFSALEKLFSEDAGVGNKLQQLLDLAQTHTLEGSASALSFMGNALAAHTLMQSVKADLVPAMEAVGMIDALVTAADVFNAQKNNTLSWSFAEFIEHDKPVLMFNGLFNPLIDSKVATAQDILFDDNHPNHMLITGPHGCGKSTIMKSVAYAVICAQVFGFVPATSAQLTPIDAIITYMNVREEIGAGKSTFMAELQRLEVVKSELLDASGKKMLCLMDELFKGTMEAEGGLRLYEFMKFIQDKTNTASMIATHFEEPTKIEAESPHCANYYVGLEEPRQGQFVRTFIIHNGKNPWWFTDQEKRKRFINWLRDIEMNK